MKDTWGLTQHVTAKQGDPLLFPCQQGNSIVCSWLAYHIVVVHPIFIWTSYSGCTFLFYLDCSLEWLPGTFLADFFPGSKGHDYCRALFNGYCVAFALIAETHFLSSWTILCGDISQLWGLLWAILISGK